MKTIGRAAIKAFDSAARDFYEKVHPDNEKTSEYEKELRRNFRLPDPDIQHGAFFWVAR